MFGISKPQGRFVDDIKREKDIYMKQEEFLKVIEKVNHKKSKLLNENMRQLIEDEFILGNVVLRYLNFIRKNGNEIDGIDELINKNGPPTKKLKDFDICKHMAEQEMYLHNHTYIEIDYVYQGSCTCYMDSKQNSFELREKELCILNQNVVHGIELQDKDSIIIKCMIPFEYIDLEQFYEMRQDIIMHKFLQHALKSDSTKASYIIYRISNTDAVEEMMCHMFCEFDKKDVGWRQVIKNLISNLFLYLMRITDNELLQVRETEKENFNITKVFECIRKNYPYITLKDLAKDFNFHENYLSRMIKKHCQKNFRDLLCQIRLNEAENFLIQTDMSVTEIAAKIGYHKPNFFFKIFKDHYGVTPMEFRNQHKKNCT